MPQPSLRPQDVFVLAKLIGYKGPRPPMTQMGLALTLSPSEVHAALKRLALSRLVADPSDGGRPILGAVEEFLLHGVKYAFPARRGEITRGVVTSYGAPPLNRLVGGGSELPPVWPHAEGRHRGVGLEPLYPTVPIAALRDSGLHELLALIDAIRGGRARERQVAERELVARLRRQLDG